MFKLAKHREVLWPVSVSVPVDNGVQKVEIKIRYRLLSRTELAALGDEIKQIAEDGVSASDLMAKLDGKLSDRITGWEGIGDEEGNALTFNPENMAAVLDVPYLREAVEAGLYAASRGALAKN